MIQKNISLLPPIHTTCATLIWNDSKIWLYLLFPCFCSSRSHHEAHVKLFDIHAQVVWYIALMEQKILRRICGSKSSDIIQPLIFYKMRLLYIGNTALSFSDQLQHRCRCQWFSSSSSSVRRKWCVSSYNDLLWRHNQVSERVTQSYVTILAS